MRKNNCCIRNAVSIGGMSLCSDTGKANLQPKQHKKKRVFIKSLLYQKVISDVLLGCLVDQVKSFNCVSFIETENWELVDNVK